MRLIEHLESHLNEICRGWKDSNVENSVRVVSFENQPFEDINTYSTLGLSDHVLTMAGGEPIRQELIFMAYRNFDGEQIASFLSTFAFSIIQSHKPILRGDVVGPSAPIILNSPLNSVFSAIPMILRTSFFVFEDSLPQTVFPWIIPIHEEEGNYVRSQGWGKFEQILERENPELWDLNRRSIVHIPKPQAP